ncbi:MAG: lipoate--protein ligase [Oscillospiraceae bacterium]
MLNKISYIISEGNNVYQNQALEEYLLSVVEKDECILYLWQNDKTVVIGRNQNSRAECDINALNKDGGHLARRLSGGGAVYHDMGNINFTFIMPRCEYNLDKQLDVILCAVNLLGIHAVKSGRNDITVDSRKFSGNAFYKTANSAYHHGTIMFSSELSALPKYLTVAPDKLRAKGVKSVRSRVANLDEFRDSLSLTDVISALLSAFGNIYGGTAQRLANSRLNKQSLESLHSKFASEAWILGSEPPFNYTSYCRYPWGNADLRLDIKDNIIKTAILYTDAMDENLAEKISGIFADMPLKAQEINMAIAAQSAEYGNILKDLTTMFEELIIK